jgi:plastocyanin
LVAGILGVAVAVLPPLAAGLSQPSTASFTARDFAWDVSGSNSTQVTIAQGGTVSFSYPAGASQHNADFGSGLQPSSCTQTAGATSGSVPPVPHAPTAPGWSGSCTFNTPGTYTFFCDQHPYMTGTIVVQGSGMTGTTGTTSSTGSTTTTDTTTTPTPPSTTAGAGTPPTTSGSGGSPLAGGAATAFAVAASQRGAAIRLSVKVSRAGAGGRLEVDVFATVRALTGAPSQRQTRVGRAIRTSLHAGVTRLSVPLDAAARRALNRHGQLALTIRMSVASPAGVSSSATRHVALHAGA